MSTEVSGSQAPLTARAGEVIRMELARQHKSGAWLARQLMVSPMWVSDRIRGKQAIDLNDLERIGAAIGRDPYELLERAVRAGTQGNSESLTVAERLAGDSLALPNRPISDRTCGGPRLSARRPERVVRQPLAA